MRRFNDLQQTRNRGKFVVRRDVPPFPEGSRASLVSIGRHIETLSNCKLPYWMRRGKHLCNQALAAEWRGLREVGCRCRFGRVEIPPVAVAAQFSNPNGG